MNAKLNVLNNTWVDPDDAPELEEEFFERATLYRGNKVVRRGRPPSNEPNKVSATIRWTPSVIEAFKSTGKGWQTRMDAAMIDWLKEHNPADV